jgi:Lipopolysaccharide kinase (Kdo/WaaP) family
MLWRTRRDSHLARGACARDSNRVLRRDVERRSRELHAPRLHSSRLNANEVHLAPGVSSLESLGARSFDDFFRPPGASGFERAKLVRSRDGFEEIRYPLPGTPLGASERTDSRERAIVLGGSMESGGVGGASSGFAILRRFTRASVRERWRTRFTHPRSTSLAEREWNLMCRAREHGISTPEPLAVGRGEGTVFAERSFLILRELDDMLSLKQWADASLDPRLRVHIRDALVSALEKLWSAGVWLPNVNADNIFVGSPRNPDGGDPDCVARRIVELRTGRAEPIEQPSVGALKWGDLPEVALTDFSGGSMPARISTRRRNTLLQELGRELESLEFLHDMPMS